MHYLLKWCLSIKYHALIKSNLFWVNKNSSIPLPLQITITDLFYGENYGF